MFKQFDLKDSVHIDYDLKQPGIASFNPMYDKVKEEAVLLRMPKREIILNQGIYNSCVGHSLVMCAALLHYSKTNKWIKFDPYTVYGTVYPGQWEGLGMYPNEAISNCIKDGFFFKRDFGTSGERPAIISAVKAFKAKHPQLVEDAKNYNFTAGALVRSEKDVLAGLKMGMPISATWALYDSFFSGTKSDGVVPVPNKSKEKYLGNHQMTIVGITKDDQYVVLNSYGQTYGFKGLYYIPFAYHPEQAFCISDTIMPAKKKAARTILTIGSKIVNVDGKDIEIDVEPYVSDDDRTMVPIRIISESLGASVDYKVENGQQVITIRSEEGEITLVIGRKSYVLDNIPYKMDTAPVIVNERTMVPIRFISEALNCKVEWDQKNLKVIIDCL